MISLFVRTCTLIICCASVVLLSPNSARAALEPALDVQPPPVELPDSPLYVTGFYSETLEATGGDEVVASQLRYVEIYNNSDSPVNLYGWDLNISWSMDIDGEPTVTKKHTLTLSESEATYLPPDNYAVVSFNDAVKGATFSSDLTPAEFGQYISEISLQNTAFKQYKIIVEDINMEGQTEQSTRMRLDTISSGYTSTGRYDDDERESLYDNGIYLPRNSFGLTPVEIVAHARNCPPNETAIDCGDYVKFHNNTSVPIDFTGTRLRFGHKGQSVSDSNSIVLSGIIQPGEFGTFSKDVNGDNISITNSGGYVWLEDTYGIVVYENTIVEYADAGSSTHKGQSWALDRLGIWRWAKPNPLGSNVFLPQKVVTTATETKTYVPCDTDQYRSPKTHRCRNIATSSTQLKPCDTDQYRSPETNRCRNIATSSSSLKPCDDDEYRSLDTNRCRNIVSTASAKLKPCAEGKARNPETNRCRNVPTTSVLGDTVGYAVDTTKNTGSTTGWWLLGGIGVLALSRGVWEWRYEIRGASRKVFSFFGSR